MLNSERFEPAEQADGEMAGAVSLSFRLAPSSDLLQRDAGQGRHDFHARIAPALQSLQCEPAIGRMVSRKQLPAALDPIQHEEADRSAKAVKRPPSVLNPIVVEEANIRRGSHTSSPSDDETYRDEEAIIKPVSNRPTPPVSTLDLRWPDEGPVAEIIALCRRRRQWKKAAQKLMLQELAIARGFCDGDKDLARKAWTAVVKGEGDLVLAVTIKPLIAARDGIEDNCRPLERQLEKLARRTPPYEYTKGVRGFGDLRLALIIGETGLMPAYKSVSAIWKRLGLAVIDGERQRKKTGDAALEHGYSPERRSVVWNLGGELIKGQGTGENALPYRVWYDREKERQLEKGVTKAIAHNRAMRHLTKHVICELAVHWKRSEAA